MREWKLDDPARLQAVRDYRVRDVPIGFGLDAIVHLAAQVCSTSTALVTFVDEVQQYFHGRVGFDGETAPFDAGFCPIVVQQGQPVVIPDTAADAQHVDNPAVRENGVRFYAGVPLLTPEGQALGTVCVLDQAPRPEGLTEAQLAALRGLATQVVTQLELRRAVAEREADRVVALAEAARLEAMIATQQAVATAKADLAIVFQAIVDGALRVVDHADGAVVELQEGNELVYASVSGDLTMHQGIRLPMDGTLSGRAVHEERPLLCSDTWTDASVDRTLTDRLGIRSMIVVPVTRRGEPVGALKVQASRPDIFTPRDVVMTQMLAGLVASAFGDVAEVRSKRLLRRAEGRYQQTFDSVTQFAIVVTDPNGAVTEWNTGAERIMGWSADEIVGRSAELIFTPEDRASGRVAEEMTASLRDGHGIDERWHMKADGSRFWASGEMMPLVDDRGEHIGFVKILRDRTAQKLVDAALEASERRYRTLYDAIDEGFCILEMRFDAAGTPVDYRFVVTNPAFERQTGLTGAAGRWMRDLAPEHETHWFEIYGRIARNGQPERFEQAAKALGERWYDVYAFPVADAPGQVAVLFNDVSDRKRDERHLAELDERRRMATDAGEVGLWELDLRNGELTLDARMRAMNGVTVGDLDATGAFAAVHPDDQERLDTELKRLAAGETDTLSLEYRVVGIEDAIVRTVQVNALAVRDETGTATRLVGAARDVSDRVAAEEHRAVLNRELSHRLKNTLAVVQSIATQTLRVSPDMATARKTLTERIGALSRAHEILLNGQRDAASIGDIVAAATSLHDEGGRVRSSGPDVPLGPRASLTLALILHELGTNAAKYGALSVPEGRVDIEWSVHVDRATRRPDLMFEWREAGGPPVAEPARKSFETRLIEMGLSGTTEGTAELVYASDGLRCRITGSLTELQADDEPDA